MRDKVARQCPQITTFEKERRAEADSNRGSSAYQPNALPLGQTGSRSTPIQTFHFYYPLPPSPFYHPPLSSLSFLCCNGSLSPYPTHGHCFYTYHCLQESERPGGTLFMFINEIYLDQGAKPRRRLSSCFVFLPTLRCRTAAEI